MLGELAAEERKHYELAEKLNEKQKASGASNKESESERRRFVLQIVQPGLAGLMDGSVSTLAPVCAQLDPLRTDARLSLFVAGEILGLADIIKLTESQQSFFAGRLCQAC